MCAEWVNLSIFCVYDSFSFLKISMNFLGFSLFNVTLVIFSNKNISYNLPYICRCKRHQFKIFYYQCVCTVCVSMCVAACVSYMCYNTHVEVGTAGRNHFSPSTCMWVLGIELRSQACSASVLQHCLSSLAFLYTAVSSLLLGRGCR